MQSMEAEEKELDIRGLVGDFHTSIHLSYSRPESIQIADTQRQRDRIHCMYIKVNIKKI